MTVPMGEVVVIVIGPAFQERLPISPAMATVLDAETMSTPFS